MAPAYWILMIARIEMPHGASTRRCGGERARTRRRTATFSTRRRPLRRRPTRTFPETAGRAGAGDLRVGGVEHEDG